MEVTMIRVTSVRYFLTVLPPPVWIRAGFAIGAIIGVWTLVLNPREVDSALGNLLLVQMLATSSGFAAAAARGHIDPLLISGRSRVSIALGHALATALPGLIAFGIVLATAAWFGGVSAERAFAPQRLAAILIVSGCGWAIGLPFPRLVGGALWMAFFMGIVLSGAGLALGLRLLDEGAAHAGTILLTGVAAVACPLLLLGDHPGPANLLSIGLALVIACAVVAGGVRYVVRRDYVLQEPV
jgi:hypothetical protein